MTFDVGARLRQIRQAAGLSQRELASRAGVTHGLISLIEQNKNSPSVASLRKILEGIPMTMAQFFEEDRPVRNKVFFAADELVDLTSRLHQVNGTRARGKLTLRQVGDAHAHNLQILHESYEPGADTGLTMLAHDSHEGGVVLTGELEVTVGDEVCVLKAGDAYLFDSRIPHRFRNVGKGRCTVVSACSPPYL
ncbi:cupin domain-containing protein [Chelatococcus daeguensis]|uniref:Transcriptional regulator with XRE-family HTH domain n=3 Tax=Chelatococcus TaxID=28209 RepID=A0A840BZ74_9HYPH|nr:MULTISPECIES: cupin domain-containing protein [Chelatococcus]ALA20090.1 XRE family transcriptional regulator [Chelatococcus sp. CO-6]APF39627.1 XRE family transcriptional regulator [Chelatococcus daeguensis]KZE29404.1 XRE family transcriptional regulator [Chelatococcus daeguensis]MBB4018851.1 transcriptional regulator with XRE-family HTH domain [Chelatococcus caeni]MBM3084049.1 cupin domain-containing protein [Chelatococcus daeguensis]